MSKTNDQTKRNPILFFLFAVIIPLALVIGIIVLIISISGFDVGHWAKEKNIPVVSSLIPSNEEKEEENKLEKANQTINDQRQEIEDLQKEIVSLEEIVDDLEMDIKRLENRSTEEDTAENSQAVENEEVKKAAASFRKMEPEKAAPIIQNLELNYAVEVLSQLSGDVRGGILAEMEPKAAAEITKDMMNQ